MALLTLPTFSFQVAFGVLPGQAYLYFNDATRGKFNTGTFAPAAVWTDITADVRSLSTTRGRQRQLDVFAAGSLSCVLDNNAGKYDPNNLSGPYVSSGVTQVQPMKEARFQITTGGTTYDVWRGFLDSIIPDWAPGAKSDQWVSVTASDGFKVLGGFQSAAVGAVGAGEDTGARVTRLLNNASWPALDRQIDVGDATLQATTLGQTALADMQIAVDSEFGRLYMTESGKVRFEHRNARMNAASSGVLALALVDDGSTVITIGPTPPTVTYASCVLAYDDTLVKNRMYVNNVGGTVQSPSDSTSITNYLTRTYTRSDLILQTDNDALNWAGGLLAVFKSPELRVESVTIDMLPNQTSTMWADVLARKVSDVVKVFLTPPVGDTIRQVCFIEGIDHTITWGAQPSWQVRFQLSSATTYAGFMTFSDPTVLDFSSSVFDTNTFGW